MADKQATKPRSRRLEADELSILCEQIALILRSSLPLHDGMEALCQNYRNTRFADCFEALDREVMATGSLYRGLIAAGIFPKYMMEMTHIGESAGELDNVMAGLSLYYQREAKIRRAIVNAVAYPVILIAIMAVLILVLITRVLPIFDDVFRSMGAEAVANPWMSAGVNVGRAVLAIAGMFIALTLIVLLLIRGDRSGRVREAIVRRIPPLKKISDQINASRFASVLAMMMKSGFPLNESLKLISGVIGNESVARRVDECRRKMEEGVPFPEAVEQLGLFETLHCRMIRVGFQAGQTDQVMKKLAEIYEDHVDDAIRNTVSIIEPTLVALMSVIIGAILLAVMLPLLSLMGGMA